MDKQGNYHLSPTCLFFVRQTINEGIWGTEKTERTMRKNVQNKEKELTVKLKKKEEAEITFCE